MNALALAAALALQAPAPPPNDFPTCEPSIDLELDPFDQDKEKSDAELLKDAVQQMEDAERDLNDKFPSLGERDQKKAIDDLDELIRSMEMKRKMSRAASSAADRVPRILSRTARPLDSPASRVYNPRRDDPSNKFRSTADRNGGWGPLPPRVREAIHHDARALEDFPAEYQEDLKAYYRVIAEEESLRR